MAGQNTGGGGGHFVKWLKKNYLLKLIIFFVIFSITTILILTVLAHSSNTENALKYYNELIFSLSKELNYMPLYNNYANYFKAYYFYENYSYPINQGFYETKFWLFWFMTVLESLPFFLVYLLFLPNFTRVKDSYENYEKQLPWRSMKHEPNPIEEMKKMIFTEGTYGEPSDTYSSTEVDKMRELYEKRPVFEGKTVDGLYNIYKSKLKNNLFKYVQTLNLMKNKYNNKEDWDNFFKKAIKSNENLNNYLFIPNLSGFDWEDKEPESNELLFNIYRWDNHFKFIQELKGWVSKELYIPSLNKELEENELFQYYEYVLMFWMTKQTKNFPMFDLTYNIDMPIEFKVISKWTSGRNAPGKINVPTNPNVPRRESKTRTSDIYYRIYHFKEYIGIETDYMLQFLDRINQNLD